MVGGLADWFAVTALFRHPLRLPIPHTAIIPRKKDQIGDALAGFVRDQFLTPQIVGERVAFARVPQRIGEWLADPVHARRVADEISSAVGGMANLLRDDVLRNAVGDIRRQTAARARRRAAPCATDRRAVRLRPAPARVDFGAALTDAVPRPEPGGVPSAGRGGVAGLGTGMAGRPGLRPRFHRPPVLPRRRVGGRGARAATRVRRRAALLRRTAAHRPDHRGAGRAGQARAARPAGRSGVPRFAVGLDSRRWCSPASPTRTPTCAARSSH